MINSIYSKSLCCYDGDARLLPFRRRKKAIYSPSTPFYRTIKKLLDDIHPTANSRRYRGSHPPFKLRCRFQLNLPMGLHSSILPPHTHHPPRARTFSSILPPLRRSQKFHSCKSPLRRPSRCAYPCPRSRQSPSRSH